MADSTQETALAIDVLPVKDETGVVQQLNRLKGSLKLQQLAQTLMVIGRYLYMCNLALGRDASLLIKAQSHLFNILKLCDCLARLLQNFQSGSNNILEKLKIAYLYLMDGFEDFARTDIEATKKDVKSMSQIVSENTNAVAKSRDDVDGFLREVKRASPKMKPQEPSKKRAKEESKSPETQPLNSSRLPSDFFRDLKIVAFLLVAILSIQIVVTLVEALNNATGWWKVGNSLDYATLAFALVVSFAIGFVIFAQKLYAGFLRQFVDWSAQTVFIVLTIAVVALLVLISIDVGAYTAADPTWLEVLLVLVSVTEMICAVFFLYKVMSKCYSPPSVRPKDLETSSRPATSSPATASSPAAREEEKERKREEAKTKLVAAMVTEVRLNLDVVLELLNELTPVVEAWMKECTEVLEPSMEKGIRAAESLSNEEKLAYWHSVLFRKEVLGYYERWRALEVYAEETRPKLKSVRQQVERFYTDNPYPDEAVRRAWQMAAEEQDPKIKAIVDQYKDILL